MTNNLASVVKMQKKVTSKVELAKAIIALASCFSDKKLSQTQISVLAYFMVYGINVQSKNLIVKSGICKNIANIKTVMVLLKKLDLIYKDDLNGKVYVSKSLQIDLTDTVALYFKIDNSI
jgi:hypothetical protein